MSISHPVSEHGANRPSDPGRPASGFQSYGTHPSHLPCSRSLRICKLLENRSVSEVAEDLYLDTDEVRSIQEAMEALHITCVNDETAERVLAVFEAVPSGKG